MPLKLGTDHNTYYKFSLLTPELPSLLKELKPVGFAFAAAGVDLEGILSSEPGQPEEDKHRKASLTFGV